SLSAACAGMDTRRARPASRQVVEWCLNMMVSGCARRVRRTAMQKDAASSGRGERQATNRPIVPDGLYPWQQNRSVFATGIGNYYLLAGFQWPIPVGIAPSAAQEMLLFVAAVCRIAAHRNGHAGPVFLAAPCVR